MIVKSSRIYMEDGVKNGFLVIENGKFSGFVPADASAPDADCLDVGDDRVIPGIFDTHNHGTCGYSLIGEEDGGAGAEEVAGYLKGLASQGVTNIFPTVSPSMIGIVADVAKQKPVGATILGIHSEGPWLNRTGEKGIRTPWPAVEIETARKMVSDGQGMLRLVALAPEIPGISPLIDYFLSEGVTLALAHSDCNYEAATAAYQRGISVSTHTGNVMVGMHHRDVGGLGAALLNEDVDCEVICDGMHVCMDMLRIYFKVKDYSRFMMISDCTPFSGAPVGRYKGWDPSMLINVTGEGFVLSDTGRLCGSSQPVLYGIGNLVEKLRIPIETVLRMASLNPCKKYGFDREKGSIAIGKDADFVVIKDDYKARTTYANGRKVYDRKLDGAVFNPGFYEAMKA